MGLDDMVRVIIDKVALAHIENEDETRTNIFTNLALDEVAAESAGKTSQTTVRLYQVRPLAICLGANQTQDEISQEKCKEHCFDWAVRRSGGTLAMLTPNKIIISKAYKKDAGDRDTEAHTKAFCRDIMLALKDCGVKTELWNKCDIMADVSGDWRKIGSTAILLGRDSVFAHATLNFLYPQKEKQRFFEMARPFGAEIKPAHLNYLISETSGYVTTIGELTITERDKIENALLERLAGGRCAPSKWTEDELAAAKARAVELKAYRHEKRETKFKGMCDFELGPHVPMFTFVNGRPVFLPKKVALELSERYALHEGNLKLVSRRIQKEYQLTIYNSWLASMQQGQIRD
ncbi:MAG: hypothetical protein HYT16_04575 [DPANN group archaeon]|nr:hypothetical protein [DPANN group archaeon]